MCRLIDPFNPPGAPRPGLEGVTEVLRLAKDLSIPELHDTDSVGRLPIITDDIFGNPKIAAPNQSLPITGSPPTEPRSPGVPPVAGASLMGLDYPTEFSGFVIGHGPCAGEKISLSDTGTFVASKTECNQSRRLACLAVNHSEGCSRQGDNDRVILYLNAKPEGHGHEF
jgi:hypothetical protein